MGAIRVLVRAANAVSKRFCRHDTGTTLGRVSLSDGLLGVLLGIIAVLIGVVLSGR